VRKDKEIEREAINEKIGAFLKKGGKIRDVRNFKLDTHEYADQPFQNAQLF
jgi:hypothetical protein